MRLERGRENAQDEMEGKQCGNIRELVDSLCRDDADMPMPPYIGKASGFKPF